MFLQNASTHLWTFREEREREKCAFGKREAGMEAIAHEIIEGERANYCSWGRKTEKLERLREERHWESRRIQEDQSLSQPSLFPLTCLKK